MANIIKTKYMDKATRGYSEYVARDLSALQTISPKEGDRAILLDGNLYICLDNGQWDMIATAGQGSGAELNISYGEAEPADTSKLWIKASEPQNIKFSKDIDGVNSLSAIGVLNDSSMSCARVGTKIYLFGSSSTTTYKDIRVFDTETQEITTLTTKMPKGSYWLGCASVGKKIYIFGGIRDNSVSNVISVFDTETETLSDLSITLPVALHSISCVSVDNYVYLICGKNKDYKGTTTIYIFDTVNETFNSVSPFGTQMCNVACSRYGDYIYIFGSYNTSSGGGFNWIYKFDIVSQKATKLTTVLPVASHSINCDIIGNKIYLIGGYGTTSINVFDALTETITTLDITLPAITTNSCCCGFGNDIYVFGGSSLKTINKFSVTHSLSSGDIEIITAPQNFFKLINTSTINAEIGIDSVLIGNADNEAENCEAYLYKDNAWVQI